MNSHSISSCKTVTITFEIYFYSTLLLTIHISLETLFPRRYWTASGRFRIDFRKKITSRF